MPRERRALSRVGTLTAALLAAAGCTHVADVLTNTGAALRRHSDQSSDAPQSAASAPKAANGATKEDWDAINGPIKAAEAQCKANMTAPELDPIRHKVELFRDIGGQMLPFEIATNDDFPSADERPVIAKWAAIRDECLRSYDALPWVPPTANPTQVAVRTQLHAFGIQIAGEIGELIIALYQQKLTYSEFGRKRQEIGKAQSDFTLAIQQAGAASNNTQQQLQDLQGPQQQFTDVIEAFGKYVKTVKARKPKTVRVSGGGT